MVKIVSISTARQLLISLFKHDDLKQFNGVNKCAVQLFDCHLNLNEKQMSVEFPLVTFHIFSFVFFLTALTKHQTLHFSDGNGTGGICICNQGVGF